MRRRSRPQHSRVQDPDAAVFDQVLERLGSHVQDGTSAGFTLSVDERHAVERVVAAGRADLVGVLIAHHMGQRVPPPGELDAAIWAFRIGLEQPARPEAMRPGVELFLARAELLRSTNPSGDPTTDPVLAADRELFLAQIRSSEDDTPLAPDVAAAIAAGAAAGRRVPVVLQALVLSKQADDPEGHDAAVAAARTALLLSDLGVMIRATLVNGIAWHLLEGGRVRAGDPATCADADRASAEAVSLLPANPRTLGNRAQVLAALGRIDEARVIAAALVDEVWTDDGEARWSGRKPQFAAERYVVAAAVELDAGDLERARALVAAGEERGADPKAVDRIRSRIAEVS